MIKEKIEEYLSSHETTLDERLRSEVREMAGFVFERQFMRNREADTKGKIRLSSAGRCARQVAYGYHGFEKKGKEIDPRARMVFWLGDLVEFTVISLAKLSGCQIVATGQDQIEIRLSVNGGFVTGHPDGILYDGKDQYLVEIKSMSSYAFEKFLRGEIDEAYLCQVNSYMECLGLMKCVFLAVNKESGVMHEIVLTKSAEIVDRARKNLALVLHSTPENLPEPPVEFGPDPKTKLYTWQCLYCSYWGHCRTNAEKVLVKNAYKLKEKSNGNVQLTA